MARKLKKASVVAAFGVALLSVATGASAAEPKGGVITLREIEIVGRVQKPVAVAEVGKIQPQVLLTELRRPFLDRIEEAVQHDPF